MILQALSTLWVERAIVKALKAYSETIKKAMDQKTQEAESLRAECEQLKVRQSQKQSVMAT
jgi:prefoldin subunit 5